MILKNLFDSTLLHFWANKCGVFKSNSTLNCQTQGTEGTVCPWGSFVPALHSQSTTERCVRLVCPFSLSLHRCFKIFEMLTAVPTQKKLLTFFGCCAKKYSSKKAVTWYCTGGSLGYSTIGSQLEHFISKNTSFHKNTHTPTGWPRKIICETVWSNER